MNASEIIAALDLPGSSRMDRRVPKKLLIENGAPTAADKRHINDGVEELWWVAALKPTTAAVPEYRDDVREYLEIAALRLTLRTRARASRLVELVHQAVPYPVLLLTEEGEHTGVSAAHKRWSQGEAGKTVLDGEIVAVEWDDEQDGPQKSAFREALALGRQPRATLYALYQGWIDTLFALQAARVTGAFAVAANTEHAAAAREKQMARQVELNLELKRVEAQLATERERL